MTDSGTRDRADGAGEVAPGSVSIETGGSRWELRPGGALTFGRDGCDIPLGAEPPDILVSRHAGTVSENERSVVVANAGRHPLLLLDDEAGEPRTIEPGAAAAALSPSFQVVLVGSGGAQYELRVSQHLVPLVSGAEGAVHRAPRLTQTERKLLVALSETRLRTGSRTASFATFAQIAARVDRDETYVRNRMATLRASLSALGVPGLAGAVPDPPVRLGEWTVAAGLVTRDDLDLLDP